MFDTTILTSICVQVLTVYETKYPHCLDPHTLETLGEETLNGALKVRAFAAHFRLDMKNEVRFVPLMTFIVYNCQVHLWSIYATGIVATQYACGNIFQWSSSYFTYRNEISDFLCTVWLTDLIL